MKLQPYRGGQTFETIWNDWLSFRNKTTADGPSLERACHSDAERR